eukprot:4350013-Pleurochrysis_carterae.AAC.1
MPVLSNQLAAGSGPGGKALPCGDARACVRPARTAHAAARSWAEHRGRAAPRRAVASLHRGLLRP